MSYIILKSILKEFLVPALNLETRWRWSSINKCKRLISSVSALLKSFKPDVLIMRIMELKQKIVETKLWEICMVQFWSVD